MSLVSAGQAYRLYKAWCAKLGMSPADFITWNRETQKIKSPVDVLKCGGRVLGDAK